MILDAWGWCTGVTRGMYGEGGGRRVQDGVAVYKVVHLYNRLWRFASYREVCDCLLAAVPVSVAYGVFGLLFLPRMPVSYYVLGGFFQLGALLCSRLSVRLLNLVHARTDWQRW